MRRIGHYITTVLKDIKNEATIKSRGKYMRWHNASLFIPNDMILDGKKVQEKRLEILKEQIDESGFFSRLSLPLSLGMTPHPNCRSDGLSTSRTGPYRFRWHLSPRACGHKRGDPGSPGAQQEDRTSGILVNSHSLPHRHHAGDRSGPAGEGC